MTALAVEIDGAYVPLTECHWVMFRACGCAGGIGFAAMDGAYTVADVDAAWKFFDYTKRQRAKAEKDGYRMELMASFRVRAEILPTFGAPDPHRPQELPTSCAAGIPGTGPCSPTDCPPGPGCRRARHTATEGSAP